MKRSILPFLLSMGLAVPMATPAQAVFGWSACEKMKKAILSENAIGFESWKSFDRLRDFYVKGGPITNSQTKDLAQLLILVNDSEINTYSIAVKNAKCFSSKQNAENRSKLATKKRMRDSWQGLIDALNAKPYLNSRINTASLDSFKNNFLKYESFY
jgi:hypothetical protein